MERSHELSAEDIALVRAASGSKEHSPQRVKGNADSSRKRVTRSGKTSGKVNGTKGKVAAQSASKEVQEERLTQVIAVLLWVAA